jgi:demethylspheroidene O-methyltransferase
MMIGRTEPRDSEVLKWSASATEPVAGWRERWHGFFDGLVVRPGFRRWASGFWLTRPLVQRRAGELFDIVAGFVYTQVLLACVRLGLFEQLASGPDTAVRMAQRHGLPLRSMQRLLDAGVALRLLRRHGSSRYGLGALGAPMVGNSALTAMVEHHATLYADLRDPVALLRDEGAGSAMAAYWPYASYPARQGDSDQGAEALPMRQVAEYSALMTASQSMVIEELLDAYPLGRHRVLLDVGGGEGRFVSAALAAAPRLRAMLFDLPPVAELARTRLGSQGLSGRVEVHGGSFFDDPLPTGADLATLVRVLFDHDDEHALSILRAVARVLPPGGTLVVAEPMADAPGAHAMGDAYFGLYLLAMGRGQPRTAQALALLLQQAGFTDVRARRTRMPLQAGVLVARRGAGVTGAAAAPDRSFRDQTK